MIHEANLFRLCLLILSGMFGDKEEKSVSVTEVQRDDQILWIFGPKETRIAEIYKHFVNMFDSNVTFGDRLKMDNQTGSLTIRNIRSEHTGLYKLIIISGETSLKSFSVTVYEYQHQSLSTSGGGISGEQHLQLCDQQYHHKPDSTQHQHHSTLSHVSRTEASLSHTTDRCSAACNCGFWPHVQLQDELLSDQKTGSLKDLIIHAVFPHSVFITKHCVSSC